MKKKKIEAGPAQRTRTDISEGGRGKAKPSLLKNARRME